MAILLMRKMGRPAASRAKGIREPKGNPGCLCDSVESVATGTSDMRVRTRSAWVGRGSCGNAGPVDACWRVPGSLDDMGCSRFLWRRLVPPSRSQRAMKARADIRSIAIAEWKRLKPHDHRFY